MSNDCSLWVIDDDDSIRDMLCRTLTDDGYAVVGAQHGLAGLTLAAQHAPCVILLDMRMPVMDGAEFLRTYEKLTVRPAPVILMSASGDADFYAPVTVVVARLKKPFDLDRLLDLVERHAREFAASSRERSCVGV